MAYRDMRTSGALQPYIRCLWSIDEDHTIADSHESATPDSYLEIIFNLGGPCYLQTEAGSKRLLPDVYLVSLQDEPLKFRVSGHTRIIGVRFYAWGTLPFVGLPLPPPNSLPVTLVSIWKAFGETLQSLSDSHPLPLLFAQVDQFLVSQLQATTPNLIHVQRAADYLYSTGGQSRVDVVAAVCGFSTRQIERQFKAAAGIAPKRLSRAIRFEMIALRLFEQPDTNLLDLAHEFGYSDQAHFINDFKHFARVTPGEFVESVRKYNDFG